MGRPVAPADRHQTAPLVTVVVDVHHVHRRPNHVARERERSLVFEELAEGPQLLVVAVGVDDDLLDYSVDVVARGDEDTRTIRSTRPVGIA